VQPSQILLALAGIGFAFWFISGMEGPEAAADGGGAAPRDTAFGIFGSREPAGLTAIGGGGTDFGRLPDDPAALVFTGEYGFSVAEGGVLGAGGNVRLLTDYIAPDALPGVNKKDVRPADYQILPPEAVCDLRPLGEGEELVPVLARGAFSAATGLHSFDIAYFVETTEHFVRRAVDSRSLEVRHYSTDPRRPFHVIDVFVGATEAPVYLLLQSGRGNVLWNIVADERANIAHVAVIGGGPVGLNPPPELESVEMHDFGRNGCGIVPSMKPQAEWEAFTGHERISDEAVKQVYREHFDYTGWYEKQFGRRPEAGQIAGASLAHVAIGAMPVPQGNDETGAPLPAYFDYRPLHLSTVYVTDNDFVLAGAPDTIRELARDMQIATVTEMLGGNIARLFPEPVPEAPQPLALAESEAAQ